jgi:hypothetical protein
MDIGVDLAPKRAESGDAIQVLNDRDGRCGPTIFYIVVIFRPDLLHVGSHMGLHGANCCGAGVANNGAFFRSQTMHRTNREAHGAALGCDDFQSITNGWCVICGKCIKVFLT